MTHIEIRGARTHNLKGIYVDVPKHRLVAFTGVSGSGKSSLVFDTICTEAQRQLVETFSTYARRRLPQLTRPPVDAIRNISPCIVIDQKRLGASSRSTVGTVTEVYTYLRMLFSRCGRPHVGWSHRFSFNHPDGMCPACKGLGKRVRIDVGELLDFDRSIEEGAIRHPSYAVGKWYWREIVGSRVVPPDKPLRRFSETEMQRLLWADGLTVRKVHQGETYERPFDGAARKLERLHVVLKLTWRGRSIHDVLEMTVTDALTFFASAGGGARLAAIGRGLQLLVDVGVGYLRLGQSLSTLSGGEAQRLKLAAELTRSGNVYVMDEPTTGLHPADIDRLLAIVDRLLAHGNTVVVIEHNLDVVAAADWIVDLGPEGGRNGGRVVAEGTPETVAARHAVSHTGRYLKERLGS